MIYELHFHPLALKEWKKLSRELQEQFKKQLKRRLESPHVISAKLSGQFEAPLIPQSLCPNYFTSRAVIEKLCYY